MALYQVMMVVGQVMPQQSWEDSDAPATTAAPAAKPLSFGDLQKSFHAQWNGETNDAHYRNLLLGILAIAAVIGLLMYWRQKKKNGGPPDNVRKLGRELSKAVRYPFGTRVLLWWVSLTTQVPLAVLLISGEIFEASVKQWSAQPTFAALRGWGAKRLGRLQVVLFE